MKILIALVALVALVGMAAATDFPDWKITGKLSYSYQEIATSDELSVAPSMNGVNSHASFIMPTLPENDPSPALAGYASGNVKNTLVSGTFGTVALCDDPQTQTLTQTGKANLEFGKVAEKDVNTYTMDGYLFKAQEYDVKGQITNVVARFADEGKVGENYYGPFQGDCAFPLNGCGNLWGEESSNAYGYVWPTAVSGSPNVWAKDAWVGTSSSTRVTMKVIDDLSGCQTTNGPLLSGSSDAYAGFTDATTPERDQVQTSLGQAYITTHAEVTTDHWLDNTGPATNQVP
jgi:hypothetical protein